MACSKPVKPSGGASGSGQRPASSLISSREFNRLVLEVIPGMNDNTWMTMSFSSEHDLDEKHGKSFIALIIRHFIASRM